MRIVKYEKEGCVPCQMVENFLNEKNIEYMKINPFEQPEEASNDDVGSVPTVILFNEDGVEIQRSVGFKPNELEEIVNKYKK